MFQPSCQIVIGRCSLTGTDFLTGYMSGIRVDNGLLDTHQILNHLLLMFNEIRTVFLWSQRMDAEQSGTVSLTTNSNVCVCILNMFTLR